MKFEKSLVSRMNAFTVLLWFPRGARKAVSGGGAAISVIQCVAAVVLANPRYGIHTDVRGEESPSWLA